MEQPSTQTSVATAPTLTKDFLAAVLIVSLFINLTVMTTWLAVSLS